MESINFWNILKSKYIKEMKFRRTRKVRKSRKSRTRQRGGIEFAESTKPGANGKNYGNLDPEYLNQKRKELYEKTIGNMGLQKHYPPSQYHENNARTFTSLQEIYNDPQDMKRAIKELYEQPEKVGSQFLPGQRAYIKGLIERRGLPGALNHTTLAKGLAEPFRTNLINYLRYELMQKRINKTYRTNIVSRYVYPEWNNPNYEKENDTKNKE
jgi:hypothetical protein